MEKKQRILLAEDEVKLGQVIKDEFTRNGYKVDLALNGADAAKHFSEHVYSIVILDINLPGKSGLVLCKEFRAKNKKVPILMLTAIGEVNEKVIAFDNGADDYLVKPFHFDELLARVKSLIKRTTVVLDETNIIVEDLEIDFSSKTANRSGIEINLTSKEFTLLVLLAKNKGKVISKQEILEKVWDLSFDTGTNTIEVYISFLRNKVDKPFEKKLIHTKPGFGYYLK
jgi:two-component system copper resistance phosphate regulon response regulator CusR